MIMFILAGASFLFTWRSPASRECSPSGWPRSSHTVTLIAILAGIYILLGTALDGISMIVLPPRW
jgi:hypothetical protein